MFKFIKRNMDNKESVGEIVRVTEKDILKELFKNYEGRIIPKKYLLRSGYMVDGDDVNYDYAEEEAYWLSAYFQYINDEIRKYSEELNALADVNFDLFVNSLTISSNGIRPEKAESVSIDSFNSRLKKIMDNAPRITDGFPPKYKYIVDAVSDVIFYSNLMNVSVPLLSAAYSHCNTYAKKKNIK